MLDRVDAAQTVGYCLRRLVAISAPEVHPRHVTFPSHTAVHGIALRAGAPRNFYGFWLGGRAAF